MGSVLDTVYNNYLTAYNPTSITRYDTHKKSELRSVYNSIVKLNKESPWYLPTTNKDTQHFAVSIKENARQLHNAIAELGGLEENGLLQKKSAYSSDPDIVKAVFVGATQPEGTSPEFQIEVQSLASGQENMGEFLPNERIELRPSTYSFDIAINDMNYEFQFSIGEEESNRDVQERLVRLINNSAIGLKASLLEEEGKTAIRMTSESTGLPSEKESIFQISDNKTSKTTGAVAYFGLDYTTREATNAHFLLNGEDRFSSSNHFTVGKLFEVELKGVSNPGEATTVGLKADLESLTDNISGLIGSYNDFIRSASKYLDTQARSKRLVNEMSGIASHYSSSMESMGLTLSEDGTLSTDMGLLRETALQAEDISATFGFLKDFSKSLLVKSSQVSLNPMNYVEKTIVAYKNPGHNFASPYNMSAYSGMMFNGYC